MGIFISYNRRDGKIYPCITYERDKKRTRIYTLVSCKENHWNRETQKITRGDSDYKLKNLKIQALHTRIQEIVNRYEVLGEVLLPQQLKLEIEGREKISESKSLRNLPLQTLVQDWEDYYMKDTEIQQSTKKKTKSVVKDIKDYIVEVQHNEKCILQIDDLDRDFCRNFMSWLFRKPTRNGIGLQPHSVDRRFQYLQSFCKWYSIQSKELKRIELPREIKDAKSVSNEETPICLYDSELERLFNYRGFDFKNERYKEHLSIDRQNRGKKDGILEFFYDETKNGLQTYTSFEVYKDLLVFLCSCGARFSDGVNMKLEDFKHSKRNSQSNLQDGVEAFFVFYQKKTNKKATPRVNEISFEIYKKYSRGKSKGDYLFPRTPKGNPISDVKFNKHIKTICRVLGFDRKIVVRKLGSKGVEVDREPQPLWELVSSHTGRKTFIKTLVLNGNYSTAEIMAQTGHKSERVFQNYYKIEERDLLLKPNSPFLQKRNNFRVKSDDKKVEVIDVELPPKPQPIKSLKEKLKELEEVKDLVSKEEYELMRKDLLTNPF
jgi:integrase